MAQRSLKNLSTLRRTAALVAPAAMAVLVVAGCSPDENPTSENGDAAERRDR